MPIPIKELLRFRRKPIFKTHIYHSTTSITIHLYIKRGAAFRQIGSIQLAQGFGNVYHTHSSLNKSYRNRKLGVFLYSLAADLASINQFTLLSSGGPSDAAKRVWKSKTFRKYYKIGHKGSGLYSVKPKKPINLIDIKQ